MHVCDQNTLDKFDAGSNEEIFVGYSTRSTVCIIFNRKTSSIEEPLHVIFNESLPKPSHGIDDDDIITSPIIISHESTNISNKDEITSELPKLL